MNNTPTLKQVSQHWTKRDMIAAVANYRYGTGEMDLPENLVELGYTPDMICAMVRNQDVDNFVALYAGEGLPPKEFKDLQAEAPDRKRTLSNEEV